MSNAYKNLLKNPTAIKHPNGYYNINRTHLYVKFQPQDSIQYNKIINDTILAVSDEPFEYEVISEGSVYLDPRTIDSTFTAYYSVVPINYTIPTNVPYTIIDNLHFTKEDEIRDSPSTTEEQILDFYEDLNTEALKISDNLEEDEKFEHTYFLNDPSEKLTYDDLKRLGLKVKDVQINYELEPNELDNIQESRLFGRRRKWNPCGRITVREDVLNQNIGVAGARVKVRKWGWLVIRKAYTNNNGDFQTSSTRTKRVKYAVYFRNSDKRFKVKAGTIFWDARHRGHRKYKRKCWYQDFNNTGVRSHFYALVHNAAYDYYSRAVNTFGLKKPNQSWLRISAKFNNTIGQSNHLDINPNGQIPFIPLLSFYSEIRVGRKSQGTYAGSDRIYGTVVHEMTHASHYRLDRNFFANWPSCERIGPMAESWAEGAETILTNDRYNQLSNNYVSTQAQNNANLFNAGLTNHNDRLQTLTIADIDEYTPIVVDLIDNLNQNTPGFWSGVQPIDNVSGYTLSQIQSALNISRGIDGWKKRIMNINGNDDAAINELFNQYMYNICD
ncbi:hypothetical protein SAMN05216480_11536 [Pustulibacterium marinum]|uniref:Uncharacterized protein n=1 Tax=Pustulibacterium marinum TaxID=1224947 RepID=A0A1I7IDL0_9FLAO|nr:hypothetical protein [Pustulibacterium marinum]SFU71014.1 hypothetical protein SAMN05216480_11536 [Pustulibacterium marinum]